MARLRTVGRPEIEILSMAPLQPAVRRTLKFGQSPDVFLDAHADDLAMEPLVLLFALNAGCEHGARHLEGHYAARRRIAFHLAAHAAHKDDRERCHGALLCCRRRCGWLARRRLYAGRIDR